MSEEYQGGVCGGNMWINSSTNLFRSSPCSSSINDSSGSFGWLNHEPIIDMNTTRSKSDDSAGSASDGSIVLQDVPKPSDENVSIFSSTLQTMGTNHSSSSTITDDSWNQNLMHDNTGRSEQNYTNQMLQQAISGLGLINSSMNDNYGQNSYSYNNSSLLQTLFDTDSQTDQQFLLDNNQSTIYASSQNYTNSIEFCPKLNSKPSLPNNNFQFTNNTPFWNTSAASFSPSSQPQLALPSLLNSTKPNLHNLSTKQRNQETGGLNSAASKKVSHEPPAKRPRMETPSPLPAFKVRKEKLGDRVTALQQLVSPFGKTDTASVLHEAIEYIKFLHDQVSVLSAPYLKNVSPQLQNHQQAADKNKDEKGQIQDLKSKGLCLVPISSTFPVAAETTADFWAPTFGGCFR